MAAKCVSIAPNLTNGGKVTMMKALNVRTDTKRSFPMPDSQEHTAIPFWPEPTSNAGLAVFSPLQQDREGFAVYWEV